MFRHPRQTSMILPLASTARALLPLALLPAALLGTGCEAYDGVPVATIVGEEQGILSDPKQPFTIAFDKPVDPATVKVKLAKLIVDEEGMLADEDESEETVLEPLFALGGTEQDQPVGGTYEWNADSTRLVIQTDSTLPIGEKLVLLLEPGLSDTAGHAYIARERIVFSYEVTLNCEPSPFFATGAFFFLADVKQPIGVQVQLLAYIDVDAATGKFTGRFVNADRNMDPARCAEFGLTCTSKEACRTLPTPECVDPPEKGGSVDEYPDYLPNYDPPVGFSFDVEGCVDGKSSDKTLFINVPVDVQTQSPKVTLKQTILAASFDVDAQGVVRGTGSLTAEKVQLGSIDSGKGEGLISARSIPEAEIPKGLQKPSKKPQ